MYICTCSSQTVSICISLACHAFKGRGAREVRYNKFKLQIRTNICKLSVFMCVCRQYKYVQYLHTSNCTCMLVYVLNYVRVHSTLTVRFVLVSTSTIDNARTRGTESLRRCRRRRRRRFQKCGIWHIYENRNRNAPQTHFIGMFYFQFARDTQ